MSDFANPSQRASHNFKDENLPLTEDFRKCFDNLVFNLICDRLRIEILET